ncbi:MAG: peptide chain release factor 2 [Candidatus Nitrospinota bacterium M3_3B_026]
MREDLSESLETTRSKLERMRGHLDIPGKVSELAELDRKIAAPGFWDDHEAAQPVIKRKSALEKSVRDFQALEGRLAHLEEMAELLRQEEDEAMTADAFREAEALAEQTARMELAVMLAGEHDTDNAIVEIHPGAGGTESQDWAEMLMRMYLRWAERRGYKTRVVDILPGEEAGIKSATFMVSGEYAFGYLKAEAGVHRLVRISPFDSQKRRHTSFCSVSVTPEITDEVEVKINDDDLKIDTYRSSGAGGQHVNVTDSAVRITHVPTGIVVSCQNERSQHKNKALALKVLKGKLYAREEEKRRQKMEGLTGEKKGIEWGSQIRSYVLQPYQMVKDLRTRIEIGDVNRVLDGDIDTFIEGYLLSGR